MTDKPADEKIVFFDWMPAYAGETLSPGEDVLNVFCPILTPTYNNETIDAEPSGIEIRDIETNGGHVAGGYINLSTCVKAHYFGRSNFTVPTIHKGESVLLSQLVNGKYYWKEVGINDSYRLTETVTIRAANKLITLEDLNPENTYSITLDTITKHITLKTGNLIGSTIYTLKFDVANNHAYIADNEGNSFFIDTTEAIVRLFNSSLSYVELNKTDINIDAPKTINIKAGTMLTVDSPIIKVDSDAILVDSSEVGVTGKAIVMQAPVVGVNGLLNVSTTVLANTVAGGAVTAGASTSEIPICEVDVPNEMSEKKNPKVPDPYDGGSAPEDFATSYNKAVLAIGHLGNALAQLSAAVTAANAAHSGPGTSPAAITPFTSEAATEIGNANTAISSGKLKDMQADPKD